MRFVVFLFLVILGSGCGSNNESRKEVLHEDSSKCDTYLDTLVGEQKIKISSDSERMYICMWGKNELFTDTIHYPISKDYGNLTKKICINGDYLCSCFVEKDILFFSFTDFSFLKRLVTVNLNTHKVVNIIHGENMLGTHLGAFIFIDDKIICNHFPNLLDGKDIELSIYKFTPDSIVYLKNKNIKVDVLKLYSDDSTMTSFLKATYEQMKGVRVEK